jgi:hypothetical protein
MLTQMSYTAVMVGEGGRGGSQRGSAAPSGERGGGEGMKIRHLQLLLPVLAAIGAALFGGQGPWGP